MNIIQFQYRGKIYLFAACAAGKYGQNCQSDCGNCKGGTCESSTGVCAQGCTAGWEGAKCDSGTYVNYTCYHFPSEHKTFV